MLQEWVMVAAFFSVSEWSWEAVCVQCFFSQFSGHGDSFSSNREITNWWYFTNHEAAHCLNFRWIFYLESCSLIQHQNSSGADFRSFSSRSFYIARSFASAKKWKETVALYQRALDSCNKALAGLAKRPQSQKLKVNFLFIQHLAHRPCVCSAS